MDDKTYTFVMLAEPVTVQALFSAATETVTYIDLDGKEQTQEVNIILCDDADFSKSKGITVPQSAGITIWGQRHGSGKWSITEAPKAGG